MLTVMVGGQAKPGSVQVSPWFLLSMFVVMALGAACSSGEAGGGLDTLRLVNSRGETKTLRVEVADTPAEREFGLSGRETLAADGGMLFVIEVRGPGFWMKDTRIPLSVAFISACGEIVALADMEPLSLQLHNTDRAYRFGLEVNQGWFAANGVGVGDEVELPPELRQAGC
jgi:uncharacterized membrane protein (UPF0127 family)